jgi:hypothetical protein
MVCEVESIDGDQSMHSAHSEHQYMPLATGWWHFCPAGHSPESPSWLRVIRNFNFVNFGVKALMKTISNIITLVCCCINILFYFIQKPFPILSH